jgi:hypothetical protein
VRSGKAPSAAHGPVGPSPGLPRRNRHDDEDDPSAWLGSPRCSLEGHGTVRALATQPFIAGLLCDDLTAPWVIDQPMNRQIFDTHVETRLAPTLQPGDVAILDNLASHKTKAEAILKRRGTWFLFLSPYSPDLNRDGLRQAQGPSQAHRGKNHRCLSRAVGDIRSLYSQQECWSYLKDAGYAPN